MYNIVYDSGILASQVKAIFPFKIIIEKNCNNGKNELNVKRITYKIMSRQNDLDTLKDIS